MTKETMASLIQRAETIDVLADNLKPLIDAAAERGLAQLFGIIDILNRRGVKKHLLNSYGKFCRAWYSVQEEKARQQAARTALKELTEKYDCLK